MTTTPETKTETPKLDFSPDQQRALTTIDAWLETKTKRLTLGGYAGTGKTTLIREILQRVKGKASVCAFTGKAAFVLTTKGVFASTMHRLIYDPKKICQKCNGNEDHCRCRQPQFELEFRRVPELPHDLVIVDEASMVNRELLQDLESFPVQVLYVGDHGQLEPIGDDPGLMRDPEIRLEQIHRQAAGSPIIQFAHHVREGNDPTSFGDAAKVISSMPDDVSQFDAVLCGYNKTRCAVNFRVRQRRGFKGDLPKKGERVICLRNHRTYGIFNGMQATVDKVTKTGGKVYLDVTDDIDNQYCGMEIDPDQFGQEKTLRDSPFRLALWDFGYCLTTHKSQGSEWDNVLVLEQIHTSWSEERWRYTAATRAAKKLTYLQGRR